MPVVAKALLLASCADSFRTHFTAIKKATEAVAAADASLIEEQEKEVPFSISAKPLELSKPLVNFKFMTDDFRYQARKPTVWGWVKRTMLGGRRQFTSLKDELATGHVCNKVGERDQTYYASSLCYWIPEIKEKPRDHVQGAQGPGLKWILKEPGQQLCKPFTGSGQCVKCAVCHNNGRSKDGSVTATAFQENEVMALPVGCMKELDIETTAIQNFDNNHTTLVTEKTECEEKEAAFVKATSELEENENLIKRLTRRIDSIPAEMGAVRNSIDNLNRRVGSDNQAISNAMRSSQSACQPFRDEYWYPELNGGWQNGERALNAWPTFVCQRPRRPWCNEFEDPYCSTRIRDYEDQNRDYEECARCKEAKTQLSSAIQQKRSTQGQIQAQESRLRQLQQEQQTAERDREEARRQNPALIAEKDRATQVWKLDKIQNVTTGDDLSTERWCQNKYAEYDHRLRAWMVVDVPRFWDRSCEKACVTSSLADAGCGVMEGVMPGDIYANGKGDNRLNPGLRTVCSPPFTSFVRTPVKYGANATSETEICNEIFSNDGQRPRRANTVMLNATLMKRERLFWRWRPRWFILEGGDQVRSAQMRYWDKHPENAEAIESGAKAIVLWDARSVESVQGTRMRWKDGSQCLRLKHFYRDYRLCVPGSVPNAGLVRDEWVRAIRAAIKFPAAYR